MNAFVLVKCVVFVVAVVVAVVSPLNLTFLIMQLFNLAVWFFFVCFFSSKLCCGRDPSTRVSGLVLINVSDEYVSYLLLFLRQGLIILI